MPAGSKQKAITLTFSKKNDDVFKLLMEKKENNVILTKYICDAIRSYEGMEPKTKSKSSQDLEAIVSELVEKKLRELKYNYVNNDDTAATIRENVISEVDNSYLEENLDFVQIDED